ncbi:hypothetical protein ACJ2A9_04070 [Anaerobacillus sp. MEB173]|uniref:hypothetical protein n=1 Tax=Anaerobacillus sp. MEB173 TaxID=3383345 RepID=UPI003F916C6B
MLKLLLLFILGIAMMIDLFKKYVLKIKDPTIEELMPKLEEQQWFRELVEHERYKPIIESSKQSGLLADSYYVSKLLSHQGTIDGFITYVKGRAIKERNDM